MDNKKQRAGAGKAKNTVKAAVSYEDEMSTSSDFMYGYMLEENVTRDFSTDLTEVELDDHDNDQSFVERFFSQEDVDSDDAAEFDYLEQKSLMPDFGEFFFEDMEDMPDLQEISKQMGEPGCDEEDTEFFEEMSEEASVIVEPLPMPLPPKTTAAPPPSPQLDGRTSETYDSGDDAGSEEGDEEIEEESEVDFEELFALDRRASSAKTPPKVDYNDMEDFEALHTGIKFDTSDKRMNRASRAQLERERFLAAKRELAKSIDQFVNEMLQQVVAASEEWREDRLVRTKVDKRRLVREIPRKQLELEVEKRNHFYLERRIVEHFKKKKKTRALNNNMTPDFPEEEARYEEILHRLDRTLSCEVETRRLAREEKTRLYNELEKTQKLVEDQVKNLEDTMRRIVTRDDRNELRQAVNHSIALFAHERDELRKLRTIIIRKQDTTATLLDKVEKLGRLGNGIMVSDFERIQTKTAELGKKVEERERDLFKMRVRYTSSLHIHAHLKERCAMVATSLLEDLVSYNRINKYKIKLKKQLYNLKLNRLKIRKKISDLSYQCGLLDKQTLMHEYDLTNDAVLEKRKRNKQLRKQMNDLHAKIKARSNVLLDSI